MSHIISVQVEIKDEAILSRACKRLNWVTRTDKKGNVHVCPSNSYRVIKLTHYKDKWEAKIGAYDKHLLDELLQTYGKEVVRDRLEASAREAGIDEWEIVEGTDEKGNAFLELVERE